MATKTIDKLRIQGNAAPRHGPDTRGFRYVALHEPDAPSHFIIQTDAPSIAHGSDVTTIVSSHPSSAASRKQDHLQRVQQANRGLTSAEVGNFGREGLPSIHFLLRGKPVQGDTEVTTIDSLKHQRVGHYKTSAKEVYRARHKVPSELSSSGDYTNVFKAIRTPFNESTDINFANNNNNNNNHTNSAAPSQFFYLGPSVSGQALNQTWPTKRGMTDLTSSTHSLLTRGSQREPYSHQNNNNNEFSPWYENNDGSETGKYLTFTGQPYPTPRGSPQAEDLVDFSDTQLLTNSSKYYAGTNSMPDMVNVNSTPSINRTRHTSTMSRRGNRELSTAFKADHSSLRECLRVHQSNKIPLKTDISPREVVRLKHCPQAKVNYNNPYRNLRSKERKDTTNGASRYIFNSVDSYIHFNKIYPRSSDIQNQSDLTRHQKSRILDNLPKIPRVHGFTSHCTDTVLLKMMFEMNKPKSVKSVSKYSDVAVHKDLDEFMIVSTPTVSRSPSVASRKTNMGPKSKSQVSFVNEHKEEDEDKIANNEQKISDNVGENEEDTKGNSMAEESERPPELSEMEVKEMNDGGNKEGQNVLEKLPRSTDEQANGQQVDHEDGALEEFEVNSPEEKIVQSNENDNDDIEGNN